MFPGFLISYSLAFNYPKILPDYLSSDVFLFLKESKYIFFVLISDICFLCLFFKPLVSVVLIAHLFKTWVNMLE